jgi:hypothetical protein
MLLTAVGEPGHRGLAHARASTNPGIHKGFMDIQPMVKAKTKRTERLAICQTAANSEHSFEDEN